jgi:lysophospholipase L1-like esterase
MGRRLPLRLLQPRAPLIPGALALTVVGLWTLRFLRLRHEVETYRRYWRVPRGEPGGIVYVALGDSTAQGIGASDPERGYVGLIAERLRAATNGPVQIVNLSRTGARLADVLIEQVPRLAGLAPDLVTMAAGANDLRHVTDYVSSRFQADLEALVGALPANTIVAEVPWFMHGAIGRKSDEAAAYVARVATTRRLRVARLHQAMRQRGWAAMATDFAADWFHPNDRGHRVWADTFWAAMPSGLRQAGRASAS